MWVKVGCNPTRSKVSGPRSEEDVDALPSDGGDTLNGQKSP